MKTKQVDFAYPTSTIANTYKMPNGCWIVEVGEGKYMHESKAIVSAHSQERHAMDAAHNLNIPWSGIWIECAHRRQEAYQSQIIAELLFGK